MKASWDPSAESETCWFSMLRKHFDELILGPWMSLAKGGKAE